MEATKVRVLPQRAGILLFATTLLAAVACLVEIDNAIAVAGLVDAIFVLGWLGAATAITHICGGYGLVLKPPLMHADFHQLSSFRVEVRLGNRARRVPALSVAVRLDSRTEKVPLISPPIFLAAVPARSVASCTWDISVRKRGVVELHGARVMAFFPGSLIAHECLFTFAYRKLALPAVFRLDNRALEMLSGRRRADSRNAVLPASVGDFIGVRDYRPGDNPRHVHLTSSVRLPDFPYQLAVREFEDPSYDEIYVVLDTLIPEAGDDVDVLRYNHEVSLSFTLAFCRLLADRRYRVRFCAIDGSGRVDINILRPTNDLPELESRLARLQPADDPTAVLRLIVETYSRASAAVFFVSLRDGARAPREIFTIEPSTQRRLVREVVGA
jgi:uncharacterized protein (DUF58 family)